MKPGNNCKTATFQLDDHRVWLNKSVVSPAHLKVACELDAGANGTVYEAFDEQLKRPVALKLWRPSVIRAQPRRALEETRKNASIDHPAFVTVYDFGMIENVPFMVMQLVRGQSVKKWLQNTPDFRDRHHVWNGFAEAMRVAYSKDILHGDPHTGNILLPESAAGTADAYGRTAVKLVDMGTSRLRRSQTSFVARECRVLKETCERLFPENKPTIFLDERVWAIPHITLKALDAYVEFLALFKEKVRLDDDHYIGQHAFKMANILRDMPLFQLEAVWEQVRALNLNKDQLAYYLGNIGCLPISEENIWSTRPIDVAKFPEVLKRHRERCDEWLRVQTEEISR